MYYVNVLTKEIKEMKVKDKQPHEFTVSRSHASFMRYRSSA